MTTGTKAMLQVWKKVLGGDVDNGEKITNNLSRKEGELHPSQRLFLGYLGTVGGFL
jgi:hypothetical protein